MALQNKLIICEQFYSIQGEGYSLGTPAVFLRLAGCNLRCNGFSYRDPNTHEHLGCDTKAVWRNGSKIPFQEIINHWQQQQWLSALEQGAHLVITGGEPMIQQQALIAFIGRLDASTSQPIYIEMETNGTHLFPDELLHRLNQINVSPKLANSGEDPSKAWNFSVIEQLAMHNKAKFKFVISTIDDIQQAMQYFVEPYALNRRQVWLMPEGGTPAAIYEKAHWLVEQCKEHRVNYSPRIHIDIWQEATGV